MTKLIPQPRSATHDRKTTDLVELRTTGRIGPLLFHSLDRAGISDIRQLNGRSRTEVSLIRGIGGKSAAQLADIMQDAGLTLRNDSKLRRVRRGPKT
jgi:DNA-directed RNA polymerase alpha subunit